MTHYSIAILVPPGEDDIEGYVERQMEPYSEHIRVAPYVSYTRERAASDIVKGIQRLEVILATQEQSYNLDVCRRQLENLRRTTPEEQFRQRVEGHDLFDDSGHPLSTFNPNGKWDWYVIGGRWDGWINDRDTHEECIEDNVATAMEAVARKKTTHAIILPNGQWRERGQLGFFAALPTDTANWDVLALSTFQAYADCDIVIVDAHC